MRNSIIYSALIDQDYFENLLENCFLLKHQKDTGVNFIVSFEQVLNYSNNNPFPFKGPIGIVDILLNAPEEIEMRQKSTFKNPSQREFLDILNEEPVSFYFEEQRSCHDGDSSLGQPLYDSIYTSPKPNFLDEIDPSNEVSHLAVPTKAIYQKGYNADEFLTFLKTYLSAQAVENYIENNKSRLEKEILEGNLSFGTKNKTKFKI